MPETNPPTESAVPPPEKPGAFPETRWSVVLAAQGAGGENARRALNELCGAYWYPIYAYIRRTGRTPEDAEDLTQGFFLEFL
jgi:RNA polymerase sigma-70 factor (ECF subfamily)